MNERVKPKYCGQLLPTSVTMEVCSNISAHNRSKDVKLHKVTNAFMNSSDLIVKIFNNTLTSSSKPAITS